MKYSGRTSSHYFIRYFAVRLFTFLCFISTSWFYPAFSLAQQASGEILRPSPFEFSNELCPSLKEVADKVWTPEHLTQMSQRQKGCTVSIKHLLSKDASLTLLQYLYSFSEAQDQVSQQQYNYLISDSGRKLLWKYDVVEFPIGSLSDARFIELPTGNLLELSFFTGGTAGYWEEYLTLRRKLLQPVSQSFIESSKSLIPPGYQRQRVKILLPELKATVFLATEKDPSCCPSGRLNLTLVLKDLDFALLNGAFHEEKFK